MSLALIDVSLLATTGKIEEKKLTKANLFLRTIGAAILSLPIWTILTMHNSWGILNVFYIVWVNPMKGGRLKEGHPMTTALDPEDGTEIWHKNVIYKTEPNKENSKIKDSAVLKAIGNYMLFMMNQSTSKEEHVEGKPFRTPPAINYIHGVVQYNGGFIIFNDFKEAIEHFSDWKFKRDLLRFIYLEKREPVIIFRNKKYERDEFLNFVCVLRSSLPFFANSNGNRARIGWGNPSPFPAVNIITGFWKNETYMFYKDDAANTVCRPPITANYFKEDSYKGWRSYPLWHEKMLAKFTNDRVIARKEKGNMFFVDLRKLNKGYKFDPKRLPNVIDRLQEKCLDFVKGTHNENS